MSGGKSSSSTATTNVDNRQVLDGGAIGVTGSTGTTITVLDAGAIEGALELAGQVIQGAGHFVEQGVQVQEQQAAQVAAAYTDARGTKDVLVIGALLVGAVSIAFILKK